MHILIVMKTYFNYKLIFSQFLMLQVVTQTLHSYSNTMKYSNKEVYTNYFSTANIIIIDYLSTPSDHEFLVRSDVSNEHAHESQFFTESHQHKQATGMEGNAVGFFWKLLVQV